MGTSRILSCQYAFLFPHANFEICDSWLAVGALLSQNTTTSPYFKNILLVQCCHGHHNHDLARCLSFEPSRLLGQARRCATAGRLPAPAPAPSRTAPPHGPCPAMVSRRTPLTPRQRPTNPRRTSRLQVGLHRHLLTVPCCWQAVVFVGGRVSLEAPICAFHPIDVESLAGLITDRGL